MIGGPRRPVKKKQPVFEEKEKIKANIFDEDEEDNFDFGNTRTKTVKRAGPAKAMQTTVDATDFAESKPTFAARKKKVASGTITNADSFNM